jgi:hypothetical protein
MIEIVQLLLTVTDNNPGLATIIKSNASALQLLVRAIEASIGASTTAATSEKKQTTAIVSPEVGVAAAGVLWNMDTISIHTAILPAIITALVTHTAVDEV